jgi:hypothetical protein
MLITRTSILSGKTHSLEIDVTQDQINNWNSGALIQNTMPHLTADEREFIKTGITADEWDEMFPPKVDDEDTDHDEEDE